MLNIQGQFDPGKAPNDSLPFAWDWTHWLEPGDTIVAGAITAMPNGLNIGPTTVDAANMVVATIAGGTHGVTYTVNCAIETEAGLIANSQELLPVNEAAR